MCVGAFFANAHATCDSGLAERMHAKLHPQRLLNHELAVCQPWRALPGHAIVLLPLPRSGSEEEYTEFDLDVLVVQQADNGNTERTAIVSRVFEEKALIHDAVRLEEIKVDTARYQLASDARAFGVRAHYRGSARAYPYASETLTLYVPRGPRLVKVLDGLETSRQRGEWDMQCAGTSQTMRGTLTIGPAATQGYADIVLRRMTSRSSSRQFGEECVKQEEPARFSNVTLRFNGTSYPAPGKAPSD